MKIEIQNKSYIRMKVPKPDGCNKAGRLLKIHSNCKADCLTKDLSKKDMFNINEI